MCLEFCVRGHSCKCKWLLRVCNIYLLFVIKIGWLDTRNTLTLKRQNLHWTLPWDLRDYWFADEWIPVPDPDLLQTTSWCSRSTRVKQLLGNLLLALEPYLKVFPVGLQANRDECTLTHSSMSTCPRTNTWIHSPTHKKIWFCTHIPIHAEATCTCNCGHECGILCTLTEGRMCVSISMYEEHDCAPTLSCSYKI